MPSSPKRAAMPHEDTPPPRPKWESLMKPTQPEEVAPEPTPTLQPVVTPEIPERPERTAVSLYLYPPHIAQLLRLIREYEDEFGRRGDQQDIIRWALMGSDYDTIKRGRARDPFTQRKGKK